MLHRLKQRNNRSLNKCVDVSKVTKVRPRLIYLFILIETIS